MKIEFSNLIADAETISEKVGSTFGKLSAEQINWKPNAKSWSIGQCFEHLIVTNELYFPIDDAFDILIMHEKRHFLQAERVKSLKIFPK